MADPTPESKTQKTEPVVPRPDISHLVMEDNEPVDGWFSERQMRLLVDTLYQGWSKERRFVAAANVGVFANVRGSAVVPDVLLSLDVDPVQEVFEYGRSYLLWEYGKPPDVVVEIVSNSSGGEEEKLDKYAAMGIPFAVIYDPEGHLSNRPLRMWGLHHKVYLEHAQASWLPEIGLGLRLWSGTYQGFSGTWLRWCHQDGSLLQLACERADQERARADQEHARAERLAARLRELGVDEA